MWRLHEPQSAIPFHHLPHDIGQCEDEFRARKATSAYPPISSDLSLQQDLFPQVIQNARELTYSQSGSVAFLAALQNRQPPRTFLHAERGEEANAGT